MSDIKITAAGGASIKSFIAYDTLRIHVGTGAVEFLADGVVVCTTVHAIGPVGSHDIITLGGLKGKFKAKVGI